MKHPESESRAPAFYDSWKRGLGFLLLLICGTLLAYQPVWHAGFVWSDDNFLLDNPLIKQADGWRRFWSDSLGMGYFPLTSTALWLEWRIWGTAPLGYHLVNVFLHLLNATLIWRILTRLKIPGAALAAAIFALHPVCVESVAWVTEVKNVLSLAFFLGAVLSYLKFEDSGQTRWYWLAAGGFAAAVLSKTAAVPLPLVFLGLAWWRRGRLEWADARRSAVFFALALTLGLLAVWFQQHQEPDIQSVRQEGFPARLAGAGWAVCFYLYHSVLPLNLGFIYERWQINPSLAQSWLPDFLIVLVMAAGWRFRGRWGRPWLFSMGYFTVMLLPVLGFLNIYFMRYSLVADRWQYFALIGPVALAAAGMTQGLRGRIMPALAGTLLIALGCLTWRQCGMYSNAETLWLTTLARTPQSYVASYNLGCALLKEGRPDDAIHSLLLAENLRPDSAEASYNLGCAWLLKREPDKALPYLKKTVALQPGHAKAWCNLANVQSLRGETPQAIASYRKALSIEPDIVQACNNLAWVLATNPDPNQRNGSQAIQLARHADELTGGTKPAVTRTLAAAYAEAGRFSEATATARNALDLAVVQKQTALAESLKKEIILYQANRPLREATQK
jgi:tetratricopeptide (TPR) repeat protein